MPNPISTGIARTLLHALGIAVQQAVMYGPVHNVSRLAAREAASTLADLLGPETGLEIAVAPQGAGAIVNGERVSSPDSAGQSFLARLEAHGVHELCIEPRFETGEVETFLALLSARPDASAASGGFKAALERALPGGSVRVVESQWRKVGENGSAAAPARPALPKGASALAGMAGSLYGAKGPAAPARPGAPTGEGGMLDLTAALAEAEPRFGASRREKNEASAESAARRESAESAISDLLRRTADLLDKAGRPPDVETKREVLDTIGRTLSLVEENSAETKRRIGELSRQIEEDRATVESIEAASRRRGMGPQLTRAELLARFSELSQEIVQPLTVSTGAIDLVRKGKGGDLTDEQRSLLHLAAESLDRMQQLSDRIARIAGLPDGFAPDPDVVGAK